MNVGLADALARVAALVEQHQYTPLAATIEACQGLLSEAPLDVAVLGQFKSGKSSLLNALLGESLFPVGVLPVTAVITRAVAGHELQVRVRSLDGAVEEIAPNRIADYVTEAGNQGNRRKVAVVDVFTPALASWPSLRFVDTPGLGSLPGHAVTTRAWLPNAAVALVAISAERPLSEEDQRLISQARESAPRVVVILTKVDLLTEFELSEVIAFLEDRLREHFGAVLPVAPFSARVAPDHWVRLLSEAVLQPVGGNVAKERQAALVLKITAVARACKNYLAIALQAAERAESDRDRLRAAVLDEQVNTALLRDELRLARQGIDAATRPAFVDFFLAHRHTLANRVGKALALDVQSWQGNLDQQARCYEAWLGGRITADLQGLSEQAAALGLDLIKKAETRFRRIIEAFRDRLSRNIREAMGILISPVDWEPKTPALHSVPVVLSSTFSTHWDLLWWVLPMWLVGGVFRRHVVGRVPWEIEKNLTRLAGDWSGAVNLAVADLGGQAVDWVDAELAMLDRLLGQPQMEAVQCRAALEAVDEILAQCLRSTVDS